jgi:hypothetical protein
VSRIWGFLFGEGSNAFCSIRVNRGGEGARKAKGRNPASTKYHSFSNLSMKAEKLDLRWLA